MAGFTTIGGSCHWQDKTYINELIGAFNEREPLVSVVGVTAAADTPVVVGDSAQLSIRFSGVHVGIEMMQKWCEDICVVWSDVTGTFDGAAYPGALPRWTLANFRTAAGIPSGFRRVTTGWPADWTDYGDAAYVCGLAAEGDKVGPWLWQDLQQAFVAPCPAAVLRRARPFPVDDVGVLAARLSLEHLLENHEVLPPIPEVVLVDQPLVDIIQKI